MKRAFFSSSSGQIFHGDCLCELPQVAPGSARLVVADPPYFNVLREQEWDTAWRDEDEYIAWTHSWIEACMQVLAPGGLLYCFGQVGRREQAMLHLMSMAAKKWIFHDLIIWDRVVGYLDRSDSFRPAYEMALVLRKEGGAPMFNKDAVRELYSAETIAQYARDKRYKDRERRQAQLEKGSQATNLWRIPSLRSSRSNQRIGHPSQKPTALIKRIVLSSSAEGDLVIDPFLGSGTTAEVAHHLGRRWIGIESNHEYAMLARRRMRKVAREESEE